MKTLEKVSLQLNTITSLGYLEQLPNLQELVIFSEYVNEDEIVETVSKMKSLVKLELHFPNMRNGLNERPNINLQPIEELQLKEFYLKGVQVDLAQIIE